MRNDISGKQFGSLTAQEKVSTKGRSIWKCRCVCGGFVLARLNNLKSGNTTSCGCSRIGKMHPPRRARSIYLDMPEYRVWLGIKQRCNNPNNHAFKHYGARGIQICDAWAKSFKTFIMDMGRRPSKHHQIDRINNDGPYSKENCAWATCKQNSRNRRDNRFVTHNGKTLALSEWAAVTGIHSGTIWSRIEKQGWDAERALTEPVMTKKRNKKAKLTAMISQ